jgi:hypothetical protein
VGGQGVHGGHELVADGFGGASGRQVDQHHVAGGAFDQGADRRCPVGADDQGAFPVAGHRPILDLGRSITDHDHRVDEAGCAGGQVTVRLAPRPSGAQRGGHLAAQAATGLQVESLVDGLRAHPHLRPVRVIDAQSVTDLLR